MTTARLTSFTDGVIAMIITIMVLELPVPKAPGMAALQPLTVLFVVLCAVLREGRHLLVAAPQHAAGIEAGERPGAARQPVLPVLAEPDPVRRPMGRARPGVTRDTVLAFGVIMLLCTLSFALLLSALAQGQ